MACSNNCLRILFFERKANGSHTPNQEAGQWDVGATPDVANEPVVFTPNKNCSSEDLMLSASASLP